MRVTCPNDMMERLGDGQRTNTCSGEIATASLVWWIGNSSSRPTTKQIQVAAEAMIPINNATGPNVGTAVLVQIYIDDLLPKIYGGPIFGRSEANETTHPGCGSWYFLFPAGSGQRRLPC